MIRVGAVLFAAALGASSKRLPTEVPAALTEVNAAVSLRWQSVPLRRDERVVETLTSDRPVEAALTRSPVLRLRGHFAAGCEPLIVRRFGEAGAVDVPLPVAPPRAGEVVLVLPPALGPTPARESELEPAKLALTLPSGCRPVEVRAFEASQDPDPFAGRLVEDELLRLFEARPDAAALARWLAAPHAHLWQDQAALALVLPRLLDDVAGARDLAAALLTRALGVVRTQEAAMTMERDLGGGSTIDLAGSQGAWVRVAGGQTIELDVADEETVRVSHRAAVPSSTGTPQAWRIEASFDDDPPQHLLGHAPIDPLAPESTWARTHPLIVPIGARRLHLRALDGPVLIWTVGAHGKRSLTDLFACGPQEALQAAARAGGPAGQLANVLLRRRSARKDTGLTSVPAALLAVLEAERTRDPDEAAGWWRRASAHLAEAETPLERAAVPVIDAMIVRQRATRAVVAGQAGEAVSVFLALAARQPLVDEDALAMLDADAFAHDTVSGSPQALLATDGLLARRPLDPLLPLARQRALQGASGWEELSNDPGPREVYFLDPLPVEGVVVAPEHTRFAAVEAGPGRTVELAESPLPGHLPLLAVVALRPPGAPPVVRARIDGALVTIPALGPIDRVDLPMRPGRHQVQITGDGAPTQVLVNWNVGADGGARWRRYVELGETPLELYNREVSRGDLLSIAIRVVAPAGTTRVPPLALTLVGNDMRPVVLSVTAGPLRVGAPGDLDPDRASSEAVEALVPVSGGNSSFTLAALGAPPGVRILAHLSARRRISVASPEALPSGSSQQVADTLARDAANLETVATLSERLFAGGPRANLFLGRAIALAGVDESFLAREDVVRALSDRKLPAGSRRLALALWRHLENVGSSSYPETVDQRSDWVHSAGLGFVLAPMPHDLARLRRLADDRPSLRRLDPEDLVEAAGDVGAGDFAVFAAARQAERDGKPVRAAEMWQFLARHHTVAGFHARAGASLLTLPPEPLRDVNAYLALYQATKLDPHDPVAARLLRRAATRTRLRPVHEVENSAGTVAASVAEGADTTVEAALLPEDPSRPGDLVTGDRQLELSFDLAAPMTVRLNAHLRELRPAGARAISRPPVVVEWVKDGEAPHQVSCGAAEVSACRSGPIVLPAGAHSLSIRLEGGLRPVARVAVEPASCASGPCRRAQFQRTAEYLVARRDQPIVVNLFGPAVIDAELRAPAAAAGRPVEISVLPSRAREGRRLALAALRAPAPARDVHRVLLPARESTGDTTVVETVVLGQDQTYRLEVRPERGEVLCRLSVRDGRGSDAIKPPSPPATLRVAGPAPLLTPPDLQQALAARVRDDDDVAPGWDDFGALTAELGWRKAIELADDAEVFPNSAAYAAVTYRRLIDRLHLTVKLGGELRRWQLGAPSEAGLLHLYFMHPQARWLRVFAGVEANTQPIEGVRAMAADTFLMLEPIWTLRSGLHFVSKLGLRVHYQSTPALSEAVLSSVDPDVFSRYAGRHPRAAFWEEGFEMAPLIDLLTYVGARVTTSADLSPRHLDHVTPMLAMREVLGRFVADFDFRWSYFLPEADRAQGFSSRAVSLTLTHTLWPRRTQGLMIAVEGDYLIDLRSPEIAVSVGWELSNGRRLEDHTAVEGENYFYPQRGPGREAGRLLFEGAPR